MNISRRGQTLLLLLGDLVIFYLGLFLALNLRYQFSVTSKIWAEHQGPFFLVHILWLFIFYISNAYDVKTFVSYKKILEQILKSMISAGLVAIIIFYLMPPKSISPKTNLLVDMLLVTGLLIIWRRLFWSLFKKSSKIKVLFLGTSNLARNFAEHLRKNPQYGYQVGAILESTGNTLTEVIKQYNSQLVVASKALMRNENSAQKLYEILPLGISIVCLEDFYENLTEKIPLSIINEEWFLENLVEINKKTFEKFKRIFDVILALLLGLPTLIIFPLAAVLSKIESPDKILARQNRVGKNGKIFTLIKFRSMYHASEPDGKAVWAAEKDERITKVGKILRKTRIDELPQLWNVLKGEMSFVGPRPERPEFISQLEKEIPHYAMRLLVKPGLSGWAQIKYPYGASAKDAREKLQYDLYYIKNRSIVLEFAIAAKTIATMISSRGR